MFVLLQSSALRCFNKQNGYMVMVSAIMDSFAGQIVAQSMRTLGAKHCTGAADMLY